MDAAEEEGSGYSCTLIIVLATKRMNDEIPQKQPNPKTF